MSGMSGWTRSLMVAGAALTVTACASYPTEPRYSTRADQPRAVANVPPGPNSPVYPGQPGQPYPGAVVTNEAPPPARAPIESIDGGGLPPAAVTSSLNGGPASSARPTQSSPNYPSPNYPASNAPEPNYAPPSYNPPGTPRAPVVAGSVAYVIQPGDTISGVGRRFQTPVQTLIDLNALGPRGSISSGQSIVLPENAVDTGRDPYATGPAPIGVTVPRAGAVPPPPTPPSGNAALPSRPAVPVAPTPIPIRPPAQTPQASAPSAVAAGGIDLQWPVRGDIVRRFGPVGLGERNNGVNIGATAGAPVVASASGRVAYVGDALAGQGLTVLIVHRDGWRTVYGHLGSATVEDGADVRAGQQIGTVGLTAGDGRPSMHFETRHMQGDEPVAIDPLTVLPR